MGELIVPGQRDGRPLSNMAMNMLLRRLKALVSQPLRGLRHSPAGVMVKSAGCFVPRSSCVSVGWSSTSKRRSAAASAPCAVAAVRRFRAAHGIGYPTLLAGPMDKTLASKAVPQLDAVRAYRETRLPAPIITRGWTTTSAACRWGCTPW